VLGLGSSLVKGGKVGRAYVKDGLKLYMPYRGSDAAETQFVGTGSTSFDGVNDYVSVADDSTLDFGTGDFSAAGWFKWERGTASDDSVGGIGKHDNSLGWYFRPTTGDNWYMVIADGGAGASGSVDMTGWDDGGWHHVAGTWDRDGLFRGYFDGVATTTIDITGADGSGINNSAILDIGGATGTWATDYFPGSIKNVAIWSRALTATEVQNVMYKSYAEVSGRLASGLVSWWALEETATSTTTADSHGSNTGTLGDGSTSSTYPAFNSDLYGGDTPVKPRAIDNAPTVQSDAIGSGSALFGGTDDYIQIGNGLDSTLIDVSVGWTYTAWIKTTASTGYFLGARGSNGDEIRLQITSDKFVSTYDEHPDAVTATSSTSINDGVWHHIATTVDDSLVTVYVDGVNEDDTDNSGSSDLVFDNDVVYIGTRSESNGDISGSSNDYIAGNICQVGIWDAVLDQEQIQSIMEKTYEELTASEKTNLVSYWALDEDGSDSHGDNDGTLT